MKTFFFILIGLFLTACSTSPKGFSGIKTGMTKSEVLSLAGEPTEKNHTGIAELWVYPDSDRTVIFRKDTVYSIMTSAEARMDSIESGIKKTGTEIKEEAEDMGQKLDSLGRKLKE